MRAIVLACARNNGLPQEYIGTIIELVNNNKKPEYDYNFNANGHYWGLMKDDIYILQSTVSNEEVMETLEVMEFDLIEMGISDEYKEKIKNVYKFIARCTLHHPFFKEETNKNKNNIFELFKNTRESLKDKSLYEKVCLFNMKYFMFSSEEISEFNQALTTPKFSEDDLEFIFKWANRGIWQEREKRFNIMRRIKNPSTLSCYKIIIKELNSNYDRIKTLKSIGGNK